MNSSIIRLLDILFSIVGIVLLLPFFIIVAIWIKLDDRGPIFYRQLRVGRHGRDFQLFKFRSMRVNTDKLSGLTVGKRDPRITNAGFWLRKFKLDELPQLINVLNGTMSLVGPRPEIRKYVNLYSAEQMEVLSVRPGITDEASIAYSNENELLGAAADPEEFYIRKIMPDKLALNMRFIRNPSVINYLGIITRTVLKVVKN